MTTVRAHFDGKVFVPDEPVDLPAGVGVRLDVQRLLPPALAADSPLADLVKLAYEQPDDPSWLEDGAAQIDHYLYGTPKRP